MKLGMKNTRETLLTFTQLGLHARSSRERRLRPLPRSGLLIYGGRKERTNRW